MQEILGKGAFGVVYSCKYLPTGGLYAAKTYAFDVTNVQQVERTFASEISILAKVNHPNIVPFFGYSIQCL